MKDRKQIARKMLINASFSDILARATFYVKANLQFNAIDEIIVEDEVTTHLNLSIYVEHCNCWQFAFIEFFLFV